MENPEEILHSLEEFSKLKPKQIPRELEDYLCAVAKTGDPVYQWPLIKCLFREKLISVITDFYETCPTLELPPCPNVDIFNYDTTKGFILERLDTFGAAPFTLQRICELLTSSRKEYNQIDKYMRALEKNILVVSTTEPGGRRAAENGDSAVNGLEAGRAPEPDAGDVNVEEVDEAPAWRAAPAEPGGSAQDTVITCRGGGEPPEAKAVDEGVTITAIPAGVQNRRSSVEPVVAPDLGEDLTEETTEIVIETAETVEIVEEPIVEKEEDEPVKATDPSSSPEPEKAADSSAEVAALFEIAASAEETKLLDDVTPTEPPPAPEAKADEIASDEEAKADEIASDEEAISVIVAGAGEAAAEIEVAAGEGGDVGEPVVIEVLLPAHVEKEEVLERVGPETSVDVEPEPEQAMEVDEIVSNSDEAAVLAEATSDSIL